MRRNRRKFTPEFKAEAVALVEASGGNIAKVAKELQVYDSTLGNWVRQFREQAEGAPSVEERAEIRDLKRELDRVKRERDILAKAVAFFSASDPRERVMAVYRFIAEEKATTGCSWSVAEMCRTLEVSRSGFYDWARRRPCARVVDDATLAVEIEAIWEASDRTYGSPRVASVAAPPRLPREPQTGGADHAHQRLGGRDGPAEFQDHDTGQDCGAGTGSGGTELQPERHPT